MDTDEVIDELLEADDTDTDTKYHHHAVAKQTEHQAGPEATHSVGGEAAGNATTVVQQHRELAARPRQYLGKTLSIDQMYVLSMQTPMPPTKLMVSGARQQKQKHPVVGPPPRTPWCAQHLKVPDPFLME